MNPYMSENAHEHTERGHAVGLAATVVLLRERGVIDDNEHLPAGVDVGQGARQAQSGIEVLLLERPHDRGSFAGAWVFPGGAVDAADLVVVGVRVGEPVPDAESALQLSVADEEAATRRAAVRETTEETGLLVNERALVALSRWHPPLESPKPLRTWFYAAEAPGGTVTLEPHEAISYRWLTPDAALAQHAAGELLLFPPTWVTLHGLLGAASVAEVLRSRRLAERAEFATRFAPGMAAALWATDAAYGAPTAGVDAELLHTDGPRHRLDMSSLPWRYLRS